MVIKDYREVTVRSLGTAVDEQLVPQLRRMEQEAIEFKGDFNSLHREFMNMYLGIPEQQIKEFPWYKASNLYLPLTRVVMDTLLSQIYDSMLSGQPQVVGFESGDLEKAHRLSRYYFEYFWSEIVNLKTLGNDWVFNSLLDGSGVVKTRVTQDKVLRRFYSSSLKEKTKKTQTVVGGVPVEGQTIVGFDQVIREDRKLFDKDMILAETVDMTRIYVAPGTRDSLEYPDCPWFFEESFWDEETLRAKQRMGFENINEELFEKLREIPEEEEGKKQRKVRVLTFFMRLVMPGEAIDEKGNVYKQKFLSEKGIPEEVVVVFFPDVQKVSRVVPLDTIRPDGKRPYIVNKYKRIPGSFMGLGVPASMKHLQRMVNSLTNQMIDYGTLQNLPFFLYDPSTMGLLPDAGLLRPGAFIPVPDPGRVVSPRLQGDRLFWPQALQSMQVWVERDSNINDFVIGRSPELPNAPRTARGQGMLLSQANVAFSRLVDLMVEPFTELLRQVHALHQRFAPPETEVRFFNNSTGMFSKDIVTFGDFQEDVNFRFLINPNRFQERQDNQLLFSLMMSIPFIQQNPAAVRQLAKELYQSLGKKNFDQIWPEQLPPRVGEPQPSLLQPTPSGEALL